MYLKVAKVELTNQNRHFGATAELVVACYHFRVRARGWEGEEPSKGEGDGSLGQPFRRKRGANISP